MFDYFAKSACTHIFFIHIYVYIPIYIVHQFGKWMKRPAKIYSKQQQKEKYRNILFIRWNSNEIFGNKNEQQQQQQKLFSIK